ncbi:MAG TPA: hypothetical protein VFN77_03030, partial [Acetobacteraceae bacterium]|nr:hypothetical protein [Acetobacteraceae bacterium]
MSFEAETSHRPAPGPEPSWPLLRLQQAELAELLRRDVPSQRAGLAAARVAAQSALADRIEPDALPRWMTIMAAPAAPPADRLVEAWRAVSLLQPDAPQPPGEADMEAIRTLWPLIGTAEAIMETGGDIRLRCDPATALNGYGCSHRPRPWA